jgi:hypothetical protein
MQQHTALIALLCVALAVPPTVMMGVAIHRIGQIEQRMVTSAGLPIARASCSDTPENTCRQGVYHPSSDTCTTENKPLATPCTDTCYRSGNNNVNLTCAGGGICQSSYAYDCLGACRVPAGDIVDYTSPDCAGSLTFYRYFLVTDSTPLAGNKIFYSDYPPDCWFGQCLWYGVIVRGYMPSSHTDIYQTDPEMIDPYLVFNQSNAKACVRWKDVEFDTNFSTTLMATILPLSYSTRLAKVTLRTYYYACAPQFDTTFLDDFDAASSFYMKRGALESRITRLVTARKDDLAQRVQDETARREGRKRDIKTDPARSTR